jgi:fermentation-respiration switch protein FrsA (DUF1100 family)
MTSGMSFMNFPLLTHIKSISPRPILFVVGEHAHSRYFSEDAYELAAEPKELYAVPNAGHVDLYDKTDLIPFDKLEEFLHREPGVTVERRRRGACRSQVVTAERAARSVVGSASP